MRSDLIVKIEKWLIWGALLGVIFLLRHLFPVIFFTFILAYIGNTILSAVTRRTRFRRISLIVLYAIFILGLFGVGSFVVPRVFDETRSLARQFIAQEEERVELKEEFARRLQEETGARPITIEERTLIDRETRKIVDNVILQLLGREALNSFRGSEVYRDILNRVEHSVADFIPRVIGAVREFVNNFFYVSFQFLISIVLSFIILWDLPRLKESATAFAYGRTSEAYDEIAPGMVTFGRMLGRAFEAQSVIAIVNTALSCVGLVVLGVPSVVLLGTIVFFCSYIPVFGVVLSTVPMALLALKAGGITNVLWLFLVILAIHALEAYALNPLIYGHHLKMHPVAVLVILLAGEHLFGIWGLILGVPISAFFLRHVIRGETVTGVEESEGVSDTGIDAPVVASESTR